MRIEKQFPQVLLYIIVCYESLVFGSKQADFQEFSKTFLDAYQHPCSICLTNGSIFIGAQIGILLVLDSVRQSPFFE